MVGTAEEEKSGDCSWAQDKESGVHIATKAEKIPRVKRARGVDGEVPTKEAVRELCLFFAGISLQSVSSAAVKPVQTII